MWLTWHIAFTGVPCLTSWGRMTHICVAKLTIIVPDKGLSPGLCQANIWTNAVILLIRTLGTNFSETLSGIHAFYQSITVTSWWVRWRLKSPASPLFTQPFIQAQIKENIKVPRHWPLCGEFTGGRWMASNAANVSIWWRHHRKCLWNCRLKRRHLCLGLSVIMQSLSLLSPLATLWM